MTIFTLSLSEVTDQLNTSESDKVNLILASNEIMTSNDLWYYFDLWR